MYNERSAQALVSPSTQVTVQDTTDSHTMTFANGSHATTSNILNITPRYRPAVFNNQHCPHNLLPEKALSDLNCTTTFQRNTCTITPPATSKLRSIVIRRDPTTHMFHANLEEVHSLIQDLEYHHKDDTSRADPPCQSCSDAFSAVLRHNNQQTIDYQVINLHETMCHASCENMCAAVSGPTPAWLNTGLTASQIRNVFSKYTCLPCAAAKKNLKPPADRSNEDRRKWKPGECFSCDPAVKINPPGFEGSDCFFLFKDLATGYLYAVITESKRATAFTDAFKDVLSHFEHHKCAQASILRTDSEAIFLSAEVTTFLNDRKMKLQTSAPDCHFQVSVERDMQTIFKALSTMLNSQPYLRYDMWPLALMEYIERKNRTPNKRCFPLSPHQVVTKSSTDLSREYSYKFGDIVLAGTADRLRHSKFDPKNEVGIYIGQQPGTVNSHRVFFPHSSKLRNNGSVSKLDVDDKQLDKWVMTRKNSSEPVYGEIVADAIFDLTAVADAPKVSQENDKPISTAENEIVTKFFGEEIMKEFSPEEQRMMIDTRFLTLLEKYANILAHHALKQQPAPRSTAQRKQQQASPSRSQEQAVDQSIHPMNLRSRTSRANLSLHNVHLLLPTQASYMHYRALSTIYCLASKRKNSSRGIIDTDTPTVKQAMMMTDHEQWRKAIKAEIDALLKDTLRVIDINSLVEGTYTMIATTTQLKRKKNAQGLYEKHKARECARGDLLAHLMLPDETYSPTVSPLTFALILQLAVLFGLKRKTVDTVGAYLYQRYPTDKRTLITRLHPTVAEICGLKPSTTYQIVRYIYGLPDAGKAYYEAYSKHLIESGYKRSAFDPCLFYKIDQQEFTLIVIHVDDTFIFSNRDHAIDRFVRTVQSKFNVTVNDDADSYLGVSFETDPVTNNVKLQQPKLINSLLEQYSPHLQNPPTSITIKEYQQLLGTLMYLTKSRPDIQTAISFAATHAKNPAIEHYIDLLKLVSYIQRTRDYGLIIQSYNYTHGDPLQLICHVDASYLTHEDSKSHTGYTLAFGTVGTFYSKSSKQSLVSTSSTHAEARALYTLLQDIIYVISICQELRVELKLPALVYEDNYPVVQLTNNLAPKAKKCKHFLMLLNFIKEQIEAGIIDVRHIDTDDNIADILTKILTGSPFRSKADKLLGHNLNETSNAKSQRSEKRNRSNDELKKSGKKSCIAEPYSDGHVPHMK